MTRLLLNASCVAIGDRAVLIEGEPGSGKSSLALSLIDRGAALVGDDGVSIDVRAGRLWAGPPRRCAGKLEIRNVGLIELPTVTSPLALAVRLDPAAPRLPEEDEIEQYEGLSLPLARLVPGVEALALRVEWALRLRGLT